jgi:RecB family exonuclease
VEFDVAIASEGIRAGKPEAIKYLQAGSDFFHQALNLEASRWSKKTFTAYDGILAGPESLGHLKENHSIVDKSVGPTRLETYASCPYRYYLGSILGLEALVEPEREHTINPLDRGSLVHSLLWRFFTKIRDSKNRIPFVIEPGDLPLLHEALAETFADFEKRGVTGYPLMWEMEKTDIAMRMEELFDEEMAAGGGEARVYLPAYFEVRYGMESRGDDESDISSEEPVHVTFGDRKIALRGKIDRIDLSPDLSHARVIDYKTGKGRPAYKPNDLMQGTSLQLALYLKAAYEILNRIHQEVSIDYAEYYCTSHTGKKRHIRFDYSELMAQRKELTFILDTIADGVEAGNFFAHPQSSCQYCDFLRICGGDAEREAVYARKADDRRIKAFRKMQDMGKDKGEDKATDD